LSHVHYPIKKYILLNTYSNHVLQSKKETTNVDGSTAALQERHTIKTKHLETGIRRNCVTDTHIQVFFYFGKNTHKPNKLLSYTKKTYIHITNIPNYTWHIITYTYHNHTPIYIPQYIYIASQNIIQYITTLIYKQKQNKPTQKDIINIPIYTSFIITHTITIPQCIIIHYYLQTKIQISSQYT